MEAVEALLQQVDSLDAPPWICAIGFRRWAIPRPKHSPLPLVHPILPAPKPEPGPVRFLFIGTFIPTKGPDRLVHAFRQLEPGQARLTLVGEGAPILAVLTPAISS